MPATRPEKLTRPALVRSLLLAIWLACWLMPGLAGAQPLLPAQVTASGPMAALFELTGIPVSQTAPDPQRLESSATRAQQLPLYRAVMAQPLNAPYRAGVLADTTRVLRDSPSSLLGLAGALAGLAVARSPETTLAAIEKKLRSAPDALTASLAWMTPPIGSTVTWPPAVPDTQLLPDPLRFELAMLLASMGQSQQFLQRALAQLPATLTTGLLQRQALDGDLQLFEAPDYRTLLPLLDREALLGGMQDLVAATVRLKQFVTEEHDLPAINWTLDTPMGQIVVDTTGRANHHQIKDPLLVLDVGGDDHYDFLPRSASQRVSVLLDHQGHDHYSASTPGADPSAATLGYGILWDTQGNDHYHGSQHAQASALFGAALLVDGGGDNQFVASSHAQGYAIGGLAVLQGSTGHDSYRAQTHAQASAGPLGVALLLDPAGDEHYRLDNTPLIRPSPQLPERNASMGQGAGRGIRADAQDGRSCAGGIGMLVDLAGDDHYTAQVFAQGTGYYEGLGILVDDAGHDQFDAAWYAMGAAAHRGAGVLLKRGSGHDQYRVSHVTSLGAAHDFSVGIFVDEGGDDQYALGDLGLGAAHDNSTALFADAAGDDIYQVSASACRALGAAHLSAWGSLRESVLNLGLFLDLAGTDRYPAQCARAGNQSAWSSPRVWPTLALPSEAGAGWDGVAALPLTIRTLTPAAQPVLKTP